MKLEDALQEVSGRVVIRITDTQLESYVLVYQLSGSPPGLPPAEVIRERRQHVANLVFFAFGDVKCSAEQRNGLAVVDATGSHASWSHGSVPFVFVKLDDPIAVALLA